MTPKSDPRDYYAYPYGIQPCADGHWELAGHGALWPGVGKMMEIPELIDDPRFNTLVAQIQPGHREEFLVIFLPWSLAHTKMECVKRGQESGILCGPLYNMEELLNDPHFQYREFWAEIDHPFTGKITYPGRPIHAERMPWIIHRPAPLLGEQNTEIYCDRLGYTQKDMEKRKQAGVI